MSNPETMLQGQVALVTGASTGIGRATALKLAQHGADVAINYLTHPESAQALAKEIEQLGRKGILFEVDVSDQSGVEQMVQEIVERLGRLDVYVSNAVYSDRELFYQADMDGFRRTIDVSMWGAFYGLRASVNRMIEQGEGGNAVVVSSPHAKVPHPTCMAYNMAKAALDQMARTAAIEVAEHGIRVNLIHPGWTDTPGERKFFDEEALQESPKKLPTGRLAQPEEIARGVLFLVDPASSYVNGSTLSIDGGNNLPWWSRRREGGF